MKKFLSVLLSILLVFGNAMPVWAAHCDTDAVLEDTARYLYTNVSAPQVGSIGGEWAVLGLARSGIEVPDAYYRAYYENVEAYVKARNGILHNRKHTEYSRVILALTAIGKKPENVAGYNLLLPLGDYEKTLLQGINGAIWALIALDSGNYAIPQNPDAKVQATREMYLTHILEKQTSDGGWALLGDVADPDVTGMALQALANYQENAQVKEATQRALACLSDMQNENGGFSTYETETSESSVQVLVALCALGISVDDARFVKNGKTVLDNLLSYYERGNGFLHIYGGGTNLMTTEQCFYALVALQRACEGKSALYDMRDAKPLGDAPNTVGLPGKNADVHKVSVTNPGKTFADITGHPNKAAIEALASGGIINGKTEELFVPDSTMTRAEFATIITRGLGLENKNDGNFRDVTPGDWFYDYVGTAYAYGIIKGVSEHEFNPGGTITREEAAVMVTRAAKLCGMETDMDSYAVRNVLSQFSDYKTASDWAQESLAFCYREDILSQSMMDILPKQAVTRAEIANMLFQMLTLAKLI